MSTSKPKRSRVYTDNVKAKPFVGQARLLSRKVSQLKLRGFKDYIHANDLMHVYDRQKGICGYCGLHLTSREKTMSSAHFRFRIPIELNGGIDSDNLIMLCWRCYKHRIPKKGHNYPVFGYNAFSDLLVHLIQSVIENDTDKINYFKAQIESSLSDYIGTLFYKPLGTPKQLDILPLCDRVPVSESISKLTLEIEKSLKDCTLSKEYESIRNGEIVDET